jgi:hypothetical protein
MGKVLWFPTLTALGLLATPAGIGAEEREGPGSSWATELSVAKRDLASNGRNPYFILEPGYQLILEGGDECTTMTVKDETRIIDGVETRLVEGCLTHDGELIEICRTYVAVSRETDDVVCLGADVDIYLAGCVVAHDGSWITGVNGATLDLMVPGQPRLKVPHGELAAQGGPQDRIEVVALGVTVITPAGVFKNCVHTREMSAVEPGNIVHHKYYCPGVGLVQSDNLKLVRYGKPAGTK